MSVSTTATKVTYPSGGTTLPVPFPFFQASDLRVTVGGAATTAFSVTGNPRTAAASVVLTTATSSAVVIERRLALVQPTTLPSAGPFSPASHEAAFDRAVMLVQDEYAGRVDAVAAEAAARIAADLAEAALRASGDAAEANARAAADAAILASGAAPANVGLAPIIATGSTQAVTVNDRAAREFWIEDFGEAGSGDWTATLNSAIATMQGIAGLGYGGKLKFKARTYRCDGKILFPNTGGAGKPFQPNMKWVGAAGNFTADVFSPSGTVLDLRYTGDAVGRIDTRGLGGWEATGITFAVLAGAGSTPIIQTTNTTLRIHHCGFYTYKTGQACDIDAIVCGGLSDTTGGDADDAFQGYGTIIEANTFQGIRRGLYGRTYFNANAFRDNTFWTGCGSNLAGGAAVELIACATNGTVGNTIADNLFEMMSYAYAIKLGDGAGAAVMFNTITGNGTFDGNPGVTLGGIYCNTEAIYNTIICGHQDIHTAPAVTGPNALRQTILNSGQGEKSIFPGGIQTRDNGIELWATTTPHLKLRQEGTATSFKIVAGGSVGDPYIAMSATPDGTGVELGLMYLHSIGAGYVDWQPTGATRNRILASGPLEVRGSLAGSLKLGCGDGTTEVVAMENGKVSFFGNVPVTKRTATDLAGVIAALQAYGLLT